VTALQKCVAALTAGPWKRDLTELALAAALLMNAALLAWSIQGQR
jgi:hypothetical protein